MNTNSFYQTELFQKTFVVFQNEIWNIIWILLVRVIKFMDSEVGNETYGRQPLVTLLDK
jgi:hypothetical protein